jgi:hypothetical protein
MARLTESQLQHRGRVLYELGRARWALRTLVLVAPLLVAAGLIGRPAALVLALGVPLCLLSLALAMVHARYARAVRVGVLAGLPAFILPLLLRSMGIVRLGEAELDPCLPASFVSGVIAGAMVSARAVDEDHRVAFWLAAIAVTAITGTLGCSVAGGAGVLGLMAGVVAGSAPVVLGRGLGRG